jgi:methanogenic corrinoid protein MtbC1
MEESEKRHPIRVAAKRSGTPESTLRAWERRYKAVVPGRADTGRRLYSDLDIRRLQLIRHALDGGRSISSVAPLTDRELRDLISEDRAALTSREHAFPFDADLSSELVDQCREAVGQLDARSLSAILGRATTKLPTLVLIDEVIGPLLEQIGEDWYEDRLSPRHEHLATNVIRSILTQLQLNALGETTKTIVVATPSGQHHDLGTQFVSALAVAEGWNVLNLGANIPARDIALTAEETGAEVVALSIVYPPDDPNVIDTLDQLGEHLHRSITLVVGGQAAGSYANNIKAAGGIEVQGSGDFVKILRAHLERLRHV